MLYPYSCHTYLLWYCAMCGGVVCSCSVFFSVPGWEGRVTVGTVGGVEEGGGQAFNGFQQWRHTTRSFLVLRHSWLTRSLSPVHWPAFVGIPKTTWCTKYGVTLVDWWLLMLSTCMTVSGAGISPRSVPCRVTFFHLTIFIDYDNLGVYPLLTSSLLEGEVRNGVCPYYKSTEYMVQHG